MAVNVPISHNWSASQWDWPLQHNDGVVKVVHANDKFEVAFAAPYFSPDEIKVSVLNDELVIYAKHEPRNDTHGMIAREIHRMYKLPADVDPSTIKSHLSQYGVLVVSANKKH